MNTEYIDIGINLVHKQFHNDINQAIDRAVEAKVNTMLMTGTSVKNSLQAFQIAKDNPGLIYSTAGIHPHNAKSFTTDTFNELKTLLTNESVVAVGECGLDFDRDFSPRPIQESCFEAHLELAASTQKSLFLHERAAFKRFSSIIASHLDDISEAVVHCFTGSIDEAKTYLNMGFYLGFTGAISDTRRFHHLKEVVNYVPLDRLMIETDSPFMLPKNMSPALLNGRNKRRNEPAFLPYVAETVAKFKNISIEEVAKQTTLNAEAFFNI